MKAQTVGSIKRRRFMRILAASAACGVPGLAGVARAKALDLDTSTTWRGVALGNLASIEVRHADAARARRLLEMAATEIARLESILSLYRPDSAVARLNSEGILRDPPLELVEILSLATRFSALTSGRFDVTVQPLWKVYADHFAQPGSDPKGPPDDLIRRAADRVNYRVLEIEPNVVGFSRPGAAITLNGIAQGYMTDRIADLLRNEGLDHVLVDLSEIRAVGPKDGNQPWRAGIENPCDRQQLLADVRLADQALSTSGSYGFQFDKAGRFHHLFDPTTGSCPHRHASVSVIARDAVTADALATAGNLMSPEDFESALRRGGAERAFLVGLDGSQKWIIA